MDYVMEVGERLRLESVIIHGAASYLDRLLIVRNWLLETCL